MSSERSRQALLDVLENRLFARQFTDGMTERAFRADRRTFYACTRCLEIISEAVRRIDPLVCMRHSSLPWEQMRAAGNLYRHEYDNVAEGLVWRTIQHSLPLLIKTVEEELSVPREISDAAR